MLYSSLIMCMYRATFCLMQVSDRGLEGTEESQYDFNPINLLAQYLMRNNPLHSTLPHNHPYCNKLKQVQMSPSCMVNAVCGSCGCTTEPADQLTAHPSIGQRFWNIHTLSILVARYCNCAGIRAVEAGFTGRLCRDTGTDERGITRQSGEEGERGL